MKIDFEEVDKVAAKELYLFVHSDEDFQRRFVEPVKRNLIRKMQKGIYDHDKAVKAWLNVYTVAAKKYAKQQGIQRYFDVYNYSTRVYLATLEEKEQYEEMTKGSMRKNAEEPATKYVWVGSAWFSYSEPFFVIAIDGKYSRSKAEKIYEEQLQESAMDYYESADWDEEMDEFFEDLRVSGLHREPLDRVLKGMSNSEKEEFLYDLDYQGYAFLPTA